MLALREHPHFPKGSSTNRTKKKTIDEEDETTDAAGMQQRTVYVGSIETWHHNCQGPSTGGRDHLPSDSLGAAALMGGTADGDTPKTLPIKRLTETGEITRRNG
jgi:hypothetical protein